MGCESYFIVSNVIKTRITDKYGKIIAGNHRATGLKSLNEQSRATLKQAIKDKFNYDLQDNEIVVRCGYFGYCIS